MSNRLESQPECGILATGGVQNSRALSSHLLWSWFGKKVGLDLEVSSNLHNHIIMQS